jgi:branched-subunit amino acid aminotransferase/4-amino-4-deoxychorismate lyase
MEPNEPWGTAVIDGHATALADARLAITDDGVARGDGAFETIGVWDGAPFRLDDHLDRLDRSLGALALPPPDRETLMAEITSLLEPLGMRDAALRVFITGSGTRVVTITDQPTRPQPRRLVPQPAPWIRPLGTYGPAGAKAMSYGPNMAASRLAQRAGGDDALLVSLEGLILEGPTFCVLWVCDGGIRTAALDLGIVDSLSRRTLLEIADAEGIDVSEGHYPLDDLGGASEVLISSAIRPVIAIEEVGPFHLSGPTPVRDRLDHALGDRRRHH